MRVDGLGDERRAAEAAADHHLETNLAGPIADHAQADVVDRDRGAVMDSAGEATSEKYRKYVEDYYRELGKKATER